MQAPHFGRYLVEAEIGRGAMGVVYRARDPMLERSVAIKTINVALMGEDAQHYEARFYQEARAAARLNHPNIVTIYDVGRAGDTAYMAMEYIEGVELRELLVAGRPLGVPQALSIAAQVAEGLAYAHERDVVHRDIKPANIMVARDAPVKITDFGIARMRAAADLTQTGSMVGSPRYMSPEQVLGQRADHRADLFSLGVILYEMLVGAAPFGGENVTALMYQIVNFAPPPPSSLREGVSDLVELVVAKLLAKPLEARYQSAREAARDLREAERRLAGAPAGDARPLEPARQAAPSMLDSDAKTIVLGRSAPRTREADALASEPGSLPASGVSPAFDSAAATQRLAALTGSAAPSATQAIAALPTRRGWRRRDWLVVGGAALLGLVAARLILRRRRDGA